LRVILFYVSFAFLVSSFEVRIICPTHDNLHVLHVNCKFRHRVQ